jgi:F1F0 ATPase subunit 2
MTDLMTLGLDLTLGLALGAAFYGGLWWTVCRLSAGHAGPWLVGSFVVRTMIVLAGFYTIARGSWYGLAACAAGFLAARIAVTRITRTPSTVGAGTVP